MGTLQRIAALSVLCGVGAVGGLSAAEPLKMQVTPSAARAPALLTVRVKVETTAEDRILQVIAESPAFYRSSEVPIDGRNASPLNVFEFRNMPGGLYEVTGVLIGTHGPRATVLKLVNVEPAVGSQR